MVDLGYYYRSVDGTGDVLIRIDRTTTDASYIYATRETKKKFYVYGKGFNTYKEALKYKNKIDSQEQAHSMKFTFKEPFFIEYKPPVFKKPATAMSGRQKYKHKRKERLSRIYNITAK